MDNGVNFWKDYRDISGKKVEKDSSRKNWGPSWTLDPALRSTALRSWGGHVHIHSLSLSSTDDVAHLDQRVDDTDIGTGGKDLVEACLSVDQLQLVKLLVILLEEKKNYFEIYFEALFLDY